MQTGLVVFLAFCKKGRGFLPEIEGPRMAFITHHHVAPYLYLSTMPPVACYRMTCTF
jgi:hypothetical protein